MKESSPWSPGVARALRFLDRRVSEAIRRFQLIPEGERVMVALSGGKDSQCLLEVLAARRAWARPSYELVACHVARTGCTSPEQAAWLQQRCAALDVPLHLPAHGEEGQGSPCAAPAGSATAEASGSGREARSPCFRCAWQRRRRLFETAAEHGCRTVALGHHMDDLAETVLLNLLFRGEVSTMYPRQVMFRGQIILVRPLALVEEKELVRMDRLLGERPDGPACPAAAGSQRLRMKALVRELAGVHRGVKANLLRAGLGGYDPGAGGHTARRPKPPPVS